MLQMSFGITERDVRIVFEKHWHTAINPQQLTAAELSEAAWKAMDEEALDNFANAAMDAFLEGRKEEDAARNEVRKFLIEHSFLSYTPRKRKQAIAVEAVPNLTLANERRLSANHI